MTWNSLDRMVPGWQAAAMITRRSGLAATAALLLPALPARAEAGRTRPLRDAFPFLDRYLALPAPARDGFALDYRLRADDGGGLPQLTILDGARRIPVRVDGTGRVEVPTDPALLRRARIAASGPRARLTLNVVPTLPLQARIAMSAIANSVDDYEAARRSAGPMALAAPRLRGVVFPGVASAQAQFPNGRRVALPQDGDGDVVVRPADPELRGADTILLPAPPARAAFSA